MPFIHLHNHSEYSLLNGAIRIPQLIKKTKEYGMNAVALTDYGNIFGAVEFYLEAKKASIKPIIGCVVFHPSNDQFDLRSHRRGIDHLFQLVLLIQNEKGYRNLCALISKSYLEGFYYKPRVDSKLLAQYSEGLVALSAGWNGALNHYLFDGQQQEKAREYIKLYSDIFKNRFYVELQENGVEGQHDTNLKLIELAKAHNIGVVASNNCHYLNRDDAEAFETLLCIQTGATLHGTGDHLKFSTDCYYFKTPEEMETDFQYIPEAITNTELIASQCNFDFDLKTYHFPKFAPPENKTLDEYLIEQAHIGLEQRWPTILKNRKITPSPHPSPLEGEGGRRPGEGEVEKLKKNYEQRLKIELEVITTMGFSGYFLIVSDFIQFAKTHDVPVGPGRGSAAGSLVAYCTQITDLDPIPYNLLFERFLNPERISMPDVDIDFCMRGRDKVIQYVAQKYGNVSQIITFGKMKAKAVLRDVGRVMEIPYAEVDKIAKLVPNSLNITLEDALTQEPRFKELMESNAQVARLIEIARKLEGLNRHASTHAAGVVMSDKALSHFLPLYKGSNGDVVTQFDMKAVEKIGLIKFDFLGLKTLTVICDTLRIIKRTQSVDLNILDIALDDKKVFELITKGDAVGVFQLESSGMIDLMTRLKPTCFEDLVALVALYRPGPLGSGMVDDFINRKQGKTKIIYELPQLKPILEDTYGVIVYQEQVMQIASVLAGYSLGEADLLRRAMGKKKAEEMAAQRERFLRGAAEKKVPKDKAEKIFDLMAKFAEYGFNKSHSAAYALVSYQTAYLKAYYPAEYLAAVLTCEMHDTDRILFYIDDCKKHGIKVLAPDVNESYFGFSVIDPYTIRFGLGALKGVGEGAIECIVEVRKNKKGRFDSFFDFCHSIDHHKVNRRVLESLIKSGAFDTLHPSRKALFDVLEGVVGWAVKKQDEDRLGQQNIFDMVQESPKPVGLEVGTLEWHENEKLSFEKEAMGFYFSGHPLKVYESELRRVANSTTALCATLPQETKVLLSGFSSQCKVITTKKGSRMAFITFEDLAGSIEVIIFSDVYQKTAEVLTQDKPLVLSGTVDRTEDGAKILAQDITLLHTYLNQKTKSVHFKVPLQLCTEEKLKSFHQILNEFPGACSGFLHVLKSNESETIMELPNRINLENTDHLTAKINTLFQYRVVEFSV